MVKRCCVEDCPNRVGKPTAKIHAIPSAAYNARRRNWMEQLSLDEINSNSFGVCSLHFKPEDYKDGIYPTPATKKDTLLKTSTPTRGINYSTDFGAINLSTCNVVHLSSTAPIGSTTQENVDIAQLRLQIEILQNALAKSHTEILRKNNLVKILRMQKERLKEKLEKAEKSHLRILKKYFTDGQIRMIKSTNKHIHWSDRDISRALSLYATSKKAYLFLRDKCNYPLPSIATLKRWLKNVFITPGLIIQPVLDVMHVELMGKTAMERTCVLALDEIGINKRYVYDKAADKVYGGKDCVPVLTVRGLFTSWKQIMYYDLEDKTTASHIYETIKALHNIGVYVVAFVSDMGTKNQGLWKELGVGKVVNWVIQKCWFPNPADAMRKVYVFADYPHLIKLLRNHLLDNGLKLPNPEGGTVAMDRPLILKLLEIQNGEYRLTHTLTHKHIYLRGKQRQNVATAFQLFSQKTASAMRFLTNGHVIEALFIELVNDFSDLMNSRVAQSHPNDYKCPYGMRKVVQDLLLEQVFEIFTNMRVGNRKTFAPFQKGWIMNILSLRSLYDDMKELYNVEYILTSRLNQDYLENLFSQIRGINGFKLNPDAVEFQHRIKSLICNWNMNVPSSSEVQVAEDMAMVSSNVLKNLMMYTRENTASITQLTDSQEIEIEELTMDLDISEPRAEDFTMHQRATEGGREYCAGYLAKRFTEEYPQLRNAAVPNPRCPFWVDFLSNGRLVEPSLLWLATVKKFDEIFSIIHRHKVDKFPKVVQRLKALLIANFPEIPEILISTYAKFRTLIRIRHLNLTIEDEAYKASERKRQVFSEMARASVEVFETHHGDFDDDPEENAPDPIEEDLEMLERLLNPRDDV